MKTWARFLILVGLAVLGARAAEACTVITTDLKLSKAEMRRTYRAFKGAVFLGKVLSLADARLPVGTGFEPVTQVDVEVTAVWIGEQKPKMTVYTGQAEGDCHMIFEVGRLYGFQAHIENGHLRSMFTNTAELMKREDRDRWVSNLEKILGKPVKRFSD